MNQVPIDELEMQLRILGRQLGDEEPSAELLERTTAASAAHLALCQQSVYKRRRSSLMLGTVALAGATLPIPLLFLWGDWTAATALFEKLLSPTASEIASSIYLWVRFCALSLVYLVAVPSLAWCALRMNGPQGLQLELREV
jgi:hypothetical protein